MPPPLSLRSEREAHLVHSMDMAGHICGVAGLVDGQARLTQQMAARLARQCPMQLPSPALQKAAELVLEDLTAENGPPHEEDVSQLCGATATIRRPVPTGEPDALEAASRASCCVQVRCVHAQLFASGAVSISPFMTDMTFRSQLIGMSG